MIYANNGVHLAFSGADQHLQLWHGYSSKGAAHRPAGVGHCHSLVEGSRKHRLMWGHVDLHPVQKKSVEVMAWSVVH